MAFAHRQRYQLEARDFYAAKKERVQNEVLGDANAKLQEIDKAKNQFFSNITHELRTPLTMILAPVETLLERNDNLTKYQVQSLHTIQSQALQVLKMINDLLDLARIEDNFLRLRVEETDIHALWSEIVIHSQTLADRNKLTIEFTADTDIKTVYCDAEKMERVFVNLISNAMKFTPEGGRIQVRLTARSTVEDSTNEQSNGRNHGKNRKRNATTDSKQSEGAQGSLIVEVIDSGRCFDHPNLWRHRNRTRVFQRSG